MLLEGMRRGASGCCRGAALAEHEVAKAVAGALGCKMACKGTLRASTPCSSAIPETVGVTCSWLRS